MVRDGRKAGIGRRLAVVLAKLATTAAALLTIPIALVLSSFLSWRGAVSFFAIVLPWTGIVLWASTGMWRGRPSREESPFRFASVWVSIALIWLVFLAAGANVVFPGKVPSLASPPAARLAEATTGFLGDIAAIRGRERFGLFLDESRGRRLARDYARFYAAAIFPRLANPDDIRILGFHVKSYDFFEAVMLFREIFIGQEYFFGSETPAPRIIDCGSHIGLSILYFKALYPRALILGFEPAPGTYKLLEANVAANRWTDVRLENKAVSNEEGRRRFYGDNYVRSSLIKGRGPTEGVEVDVVKLSRYIDQPVDFLKIDVEGAEGAVLEDLAASDKLRLVRRLTIEYHHHAAGIEGRLSALLKILEDHGFGYQIDARPKRPSGTGAYEDILILAYQKETDNN